jgi:hypothetical protein
MKNMIGAKAAANVLLTALGAPAIFHILVMLRILPSSIVWDGQAGGTSGNMMVREVVGVVVTLLFGLTPEAVAYGS